MITTSDSVGKDAVVRYPIRILEGSMCQYDLVELAVGKLAWIEGAILPILSDFMLLSIMA